MGSLDLQPWRLRQALLLSSGVSGEACHSQDLHSTQWGGGPLPTVPGSSQPHQAMRGAPSLGVMQVPWGARTSPSSGRHPHRLRQSGAGDCPPKEKADLRPQDTGHQEPKGIKTELKITSRGWSPVPRWPQKHLTDLRAAVIDTLGAISQAVEMRGKSEGLGNKR